MPRSAPPQDTRPSGNEYRKDELVQVTLRPGKYPGETIGEPTQGRRTPPFIVIEKIPPGFFPGEKVEVRVVFTSPRRAAGEVVGPEGVVKEIEKQLGQALAKGEKYWRDNLLIGSVPIKSERIQKRERRDGPPRFEYEFQDPHEGNLPFKVFIPNLPADWDQKSSTMTELQVKSIEIHKRDKRLFGEAWATGFPEPKVSSEQIAKKKAQELIREISGQGKKVTHDLATAKATIVKKGDRWVIPNMGDEVFGAEVRLDVPDDWTPQLLTSEPVEYKIVAAKVEGGQLRALAQIKGVMAGLTEDKATPGEARAEKGFAQKFADVVRPLMTPELKPALDPLLDEFSKPETEEFKQLRRRLELIDEIAQKLAELRKQMAAAAGEDDRLVIQLSTLVTQQVRLKEERVRVDTLVKEAQEVWRGEIDEFRRSMDEHSRGRLQRLDKLGPLVHQNAESRVYDLVNGTETIYGLHELSLDEVRESEVANQHVLQQKKEFIYDGVWPEKPDDLDYRLSEIAEDFLVAELFAPHITDRIAELERIATGAPAPVSPPPPSPELGLPVPVVVPEPAPTPDTGKSIVVEAVEELTVDEIMSRLREYGFGIGEFVGFATKSRRKLEKMFGVTGLPEQLRIQHISLPDEEVALDLPDGTTGVISIEQLYLMAQENVGLSNMLEAADIQTNKMIELSDEVVVAVLRPRMTQWVAEHAGKPIPKKARFEGVDFVAGEVALDIEGAADAGVIRIPLEDFSRLVTEKKVTVLKGVGPLEAGPKMARIEAVRPTGRVVERPLSQEVAAGQTWRYEGVPTKHLNPGENIRIESVDDEKGFVRLLTAQEAATAHREQRPAQKFLATRDIWRALPKTFVSGPQPEAAVGKAPPGAEEERLLKEIEVGQLYTYQGADQHPFKLNDQFRITVLDAELKRVTFVILREEELALAKKQKPQPYTLKLHQWERIKKGLLGHGPVRPPLPPSPIERNTVLEASSPPKVGELETPGSFTELVDLIRNRNLIELAKAEVKKRAGMFSGLASVFMGDPFGDMTRKIERIAVVSGDALAVNKMLKERLEHVVPASLSVDAMLTELKQAEKLYRNAEAVALKYTIDQFNQLLTGKKVGTEDERAILLESVDTELKHLQAVNAKAHKVLETHPTLPPPTF